MYIINYAITFYIERRLQFGIAVHDHTIQASQYLKNTIAVLKPLLYLIIRYVQLDVFLLFYS